MNKGRIKLFCIEINNKNIRMEDNKRKIEAKEFLNKTVVITEASSGIGKACALYYLNEGAKVFLCGRDENSLREIGEKFPEQAITVVIDLSIDMQIYDLKSTVIENTGGADIIINCAGVMFDADTEKSFPQDYDYSLDVNMRSIFLMFRLFKEFIKSGVSIVNVSCLYGSKPWQGCTGYAMTKAGVEALTKFAAAELSEIGVRVNCVTACPVDTNCYRFVGVTEKEYSQIRERISKNIPMQRMANPEDIVRAISFLSSNKRSGKITGQIVKVDGGRSLTSSGYTPWMGSRQMNSRFEPDGVQGNLFGDIYKKIFKKKEEPHQAQVFPTKDDEIDVYFNQSNWSTKSSDAHEKVMASYKNIEQNDAFLKKKYVDKK